MGWYTVTKRINGRAYLYLQVTYREGGRVKTKNKYLGKAHGSSRAFAQGALSNLPTANEYPKIEKPSGGLKLDRIKRLSHALEKSRGENSPCTTSAGQLG